MWPELRSGGPGLKSTQAYPRLFCRRVARHHKTWCVAARQSFWEETPCTQDLGTAPTVPEPFRLKAGPLLEAAGLGVGILFL